MKTKKAKWTQKASKAIAEAEADRVIASLSEMPSDQRVFVLGEIATWLSVEADDIDDQDYEAKYGPD